MKARRPVKRAYTSPLREGQARDTRHAIVVAAADLFASRGYASVSIDAIAKSAGVSRATVFSAYSGKAAILEAAYGLAFARAAGGGEGVPLRERPRTEILHAERTARGWLRSYAALAMDICSVLAPINEAVREAASSDAEARALLTREYDVRRKGADFIVEQTAKRGRLREGIDRKAAADVVWVLNDPSVYFMLVHRSGWKPESYRDWLADTLIHELLGS